MTTINLPFWFLQWWDYFGCHVDYLKDHPLVENVSSISKIIFNQLLSKGSFPPSLFFVQNFLFPGYVHGSMITIFKTDIQFLFVNSKLNNEIPLQLNPKVPN
jgi:hypothetical protein